MLTVLVWVAGYWLGDVLAMATPLKRVRGLGAAHRGTETFWRQRLTAVANIPLVLFLIWSIVTHIGAGYAGEGYLARPSSLCSCSRW